MRFLVSVTYCVLLVPLYPVNASVSRVWRYRNLIITIITSRHYRGRFYYYYYFFYAQGISDTEGEEKNWLENVNAGMTISPGGLPPQNCCGAR